ncbi:MAG: sulfatase-like hydrolase/transferase [Lentisphaerae bacterium]|jgi:arylsulfatase A-like enzyme|nr:sulfatase-like hydrolase/transferase [Lentisphaerota bacterium]MBT4819208.1 sulfatase-like hydrolase/transferase [Lentisphaerota bacterium]MBT5609780.1 sulfatase-like hydrolase/transferase [Lentisphaerota bacterium]MBT7062092.1 sulfatase-like hydrolase/transferase [Lentisphaerota bacterium]MBT7847310.1 sulfatase-like hydrolase/transferase [Lentisphaerota bacterium]
MTKTLSLVVVLALNLGVVAEAAATKPNILLILSDDHAKKAIGCYGNTDIKTPALDRIAKEGMRFEHALTPNSFCTPSRAAVLTGKYSHKNGVTRLNQEFDGSQQTFPKLLRAAGYETSLFGKWHLLSRPTGFDHYCVMKMQGMVVNPTVFEPQHGWIVWGRNTRKTYLRGGRKLKGYNNDVITSEALTWLKDKRDPDKPFCLLLHPKPPHQPYHPPKKYEDFLEDVDIPEPATLLDDYKGRTPEAIQDKMTSNRLVLGPAFRKMRQKLERESPQITRDELTKGIYQDYIKGYYRLVKSVDDNVARVLDYLDASGLAENTLVIYTSDQGFSLGEHGFYNKQWMYEGPLHQPLLVRYPGVVRAGTVHDSMVNHVDLAPTLLDVAGLPVPNDMQGHSLKPILEGKAQKVRDASYYHFYSHGERLPEMIGVRTSTHKLIHYPGMAEPYQWELFDLKADPEEMSNLHDHPGHKEIRDSLKEELRKLIKEVDDPVEAPKLMGGETANNRSDQAQTGVRTNRLVANLSAGRKQTVVTYGTSLTRVGAWPDQLRAVLEQHYPGQATLINGAQGGSNSAWGRKSFDERVIAKKPDTVFIEFAINDAVAGRKVSIQRARENLEDMVNRLLTARPNCEIILMTMNPAVGHHRNRRPDLAAYYQMYRDVANDRGFQLIDHHPVWKELLNEDPGRFLGYVPDGIHPVRAGTLRVITPAIVRSLGLKPGNPELNTRTPCWTYLFKMMDKEVKRNGETTRGEYDRYWMKQFAKQDADQDGLLKPGEYKPAVVFEHVDANADGTITSKEYLAIYASHFERRDTNSDGTVDGGEIQVAQRMR